MNKDGKFKKGMTPWNKGLKGSFEVKEIGRKMAETRRKNGWFKDIIGFRKKRSDYMKSSDNHFLGKKMSKETIQKIVNKRKENDSYKHNEKWCKNHSLKIRGENNPWWKGGISNNPYPVDWNYTLRRSIRERDKYVCQLCSKQQEEETFLIHHIDYDKKNCDPKNLITLCRGCHSKTNTNREYWEKYFNKKVGL